MVNLANKDCLDRRAALLGESARAYLDIWWSFDGRWGESIETLSDIQRGRQLLHTDCQYLLESLLGSEPRFPANGWVDGFYPDRIEVTARDALHIPGTFLWVEGQENWWLEPGYVSIALAPHTSVIRKYLLQFGDAEKGLATRPYSRRRQQIWAAPKEWLFAFDGAGRG